MRCTLKELKHMHVETVSGQELGHVCDIVIESTGQLIAQYMVKSSILSTKQYCISREQIVRWEKDKIIVDDAIFTEQQASEESIPGQLGSSPIAMITEE